MSTPRKPGAPVVADNWLEVDRAGLRKLLDQRGRGFALLELIQNAWDEPGVTYVRVTLKPEDRRARWRLVVEDDAPEGFSDLSHAYRMFAESKKKGDAEKRGRFNLGEKLVLAICESASVTSTTGRIEFLPDGTRQAKAGIKTTAGSRFEAVLEMTKAQADEALAKVKTLIPPAGIATWVNGEQVMAREPYMVVDVRGLRTVVADDEGNLRFSDRNTKVTLYEPFPGEEPTIYEMGIPVVENGDRWHYDVQQKVPLNVDRDNVTPGYLRILRTFVANATADKLTEEETKATWVKEALEDRRIEPEAVRSIVTTRFGDDAVIYDPSDQEANKLAMAEGRPVIHSSSLSRAAWENVRRANQAVEAGGGVPFLLPAGRVTPSPSLALDGDEPPIPEAEWSDGMRRTTDYAIELAEVVGVGRIRVIWMKRASTTNGEGCAAAFGSGFLRLNLQAVGNEPGQQKLDELLIHEFAHHWSSDHFDGRFLNAACRIGARMAAEAQARNLPRRQEAKLAAGGGGR